jgi:hypothetical protein
VCGAAQYWSPFKALKANQIDLYEQQKSNGKNIIVAIFFTMLVFSYLIFCF